MGHMLYDAVNVLIFTVFKLWEAACTGHHWNQLSFIPKCHSISFSVEVINCLGNSLALFWNKLWYKINDIKMWIIRNVLVHKRLFSWKCRRNIVAYMVAIFDKAWLWCYGYTKEKRSYDPLSVSPPFMALQTIRHVRGMGWLYTYLGKFLKCKKMQLSKC